MIESNARAARNPVLEALKSCRTHFIAAAIFSAGSNLLYLVPTLYMMQVYNRVLPTGGLITLAALSLVALAGIGTLSALDWLRGRLLIRAGAQLEATLAEPTLQITLTRASLSRLERAEAIRGFDTLRQAISSPAIVSLLDAPWTIIYILVAFLLHPALGLLALGSALVLSILSWRNERSIKQPLSTASEAANAAYARQHHAVTHAAEVRALGLGSALVRRQLEDRTNASHLQAQANFASGNYAGIIKFIRLSVQSAALGLGAVLAVEGAISGGAVFAASLILSRALQPVEQVNGAWSSLVQARHVYEKLTALFVDYEDRPHTTLPAPTGAMQIERLTVLAPQSDRIALADVDFQLAAGEIVGLVGPSGAGKSTLLRALSGACVPARGHVRFDGASASDWDAEQLAAHIGYLPQSFVLFAGTVKENISRFRGALDADTATIDKAVIDAAKAIDAHEMIQRLPLGYDTPIGTGGIGLSAGQSQRIAMARALFGDPAILLLDEPTAHLDAEATHAFVKTLAALRQKGRTVLFATHSSDILAATDKLLLLRNGRVERFAPLADAVPALRPVSHSPVKA